MNKEQLEKTFDVPMTLAQTIACLEHLQTYLSKANPKAKIIVDSLPDGGNPEEFTPEQKQGLITVMKIAELNLAYKAMEKAADPQMEKFNASISEDHKKRARAFNDDMNQAN